MIEWVIEGLREMGASGEWVYIVLAALLFSDMRHNKKMKALAEEADEIIRHLRKANTKMRMELERNGIDWDDRKKEYDQV